MKECSTLKKNIYDKDLFWPKDVTLLILSIGSIYFALLFLRPISFPDLLRYGEIPREMIAHDNMITPYFNGVKDFSIPPLYFWLQIISIKLFGFSTFALRVCSAMFATAGCIMAYTLGRIFFGRRCGIISAIMLSTNFSYFLYAQSITPYMVSNIVFSAALFFFLYATQVFYIKRKVMISLMWCFIALTNLALGINGLFLVLLIILLYILLTEKLDHLKILFSPIGILLFFLITTPWYVLAEKHNPGFLNHYFLQTHLVEAFSQGAFSYKSALFAFPLLFLAILPWSIFFIKGMRLTSLKSWRKLHDKQYTIFFFLWIIIILLDTILSSTKMPLLLLLALPMNIMIARHLSLFWGKQKLATQKSKYEILFALFFTTIAVWLGLYYIDILSYSTGVPPNINLLSISLLAITLLATSVLSIRSFPILFASLYFTSLICFVTFNTAFLTKETSIKFLFGKIQSTLKQDDIIVSYDKFYDELPFYAKRPIIAVNWEEQPLYGKIHQNTSAWVIQAETLWQYWDKQEKTFYLFIPKTSYQKLTSQQKKAFISTG